MTRARTRGRLFTKRARVLDTDAQKNAAKNQAAMIRKIRRDVAFWPEEWLARLNSEGIPPADASQRAGPMWRLVVDALQDLAQAGRLSRRSALECLGSYLGNFDLVARHLGEGDPAAATLRIGASWLKAFVDLNPAPRGA